MRRYLIFIGIGLFLGLLLIAAVTLQRPYTFHGSVIQDPSPAPDFSLTTAQGSPFQLSSQHGKLVLIFFGFTNCQDVCPTTLAQLKLVRQSLGKDAGRLQVVFITVDPGRDTPPVVGKYAAGFDPSFVGLSGSQAQLDPVMKSYGVYAKLDKSSPADVTYNVEHSTQVYVIDPAGNLRMTFPYGTATDDILQDVKQLLK